MNPGKKIFAALFATVLAFGITACGGNAGSSSAAGTSATTSASAATSASESASTASDSAAMQQALVDVLTGKGLVSRFAGQDVTDATVTNVEEAETVMGSLVERMGGDATTNMQPVAVIPTDTGATHYIFRQEAGGIMVFGGSAKLIANKDGKVTGLVSSILPDVKLPSLSESAVSQEAAEQEVVNTLASVGLTGIKVESDYTTQSIIPLPYAPERYMLAWVIYIESPATIVDDQAYLANYVSIDGDYLYNMPVSEPNNDEALSGQKIDFDFSAYDQREQSFDIVKNDVTSQVTLPVLVDKQTGKVAFVGDAERKILCADYTEMMESGQIATPFADGEPYNNSDLAVYESFIRVFDVYDSMGWHGPDGQGTASLLMMNYTEDGEPCDNCVYSGKRNGWETFAFGRVRDYGSAIDVVAHEFTHCVTSTTMTTNLYLNEPGAINEGMSDIMGNLMAMALEGDEDRAWLIGENAIEGGVRSMSDPVSHFQPESRWGVYYAPDVMEGTNTNDWGGVHGNSSLLNIISYKLDKAGMGVGEQIYYWMNVALAMVPATDYAQLAELLPWVMQQTGFSQYVDALNQAIVEAGYAKLEPPSELPAGAGAIKLEYPNAEEANQGYVRIAFREKSHLDGRLEMDTWPAQNTTLVNAVVPAGDYYVWAMIGPDPSMAASKVYTDEGWVDFGNDDTPITDVATLVHVDEGKVVELENSGLG